MKKSKDELNIISYEEFGKLLEVLTAKIEKYLSENNIKIDLIIPILRSRAFTGLHIASKLGVSNILPAQYKIFLF